MEKRKGKEEKRKGEKERGRRAKEKEKEKEKMKQKREKERERKKRRIKKNFLNYFLLILRGSKRNKHCCHDMRELMKMLEFGQRGYGSGNFGLRTKNGYQQTNGD